ncbi:LOW QUALITY PROTEIN: leucine-rich repeat-containing protein 75A [Trichosurus vulpecula]|uniref:LOW QUALITY PROTEIN: leucine-rich repeat-containing protein 75A n=1 Tax=Trichosurus vulpecula TaxID=9337 RepID=UPI00186B277F|nr:LOW QUALITY PROTEIN: leucine-rich repeat-containing protein 75A [Trichosurus vulpecula]
MGIRQTKGSLAESSGAPPRCAPDPDPEPAPAPAPAPAAPRRRSSARERGELWAALLLRPGDKAARAGSASGPGLAPYHRRVSMIQELLSLVRQGRQEAAGELLLQLRQDLGMESTSLDDVLYRYASFRNLVDPISHDLIISLARYVHCPKPEGDALGTVEKLCRQLIYHLSPHSQWKRQSFVKRKSQACVKAALLGPPSDHTVDLSGISMASRDLERLIAYLQRCRDQVEVLELGFTDLTDDMVLRLLPVLSSLPHLTTLALNGNRLTKAVLRDFTDTLKDLSKFPCVTWIDLGNNVDIYSLPQPFLLSLRRRSPKQGHLPTILELGEGPVGGEESEDSMPGEVDSGENHPATETQNKSLVEKASATPIVSQT